METMHSTKRIIYDLNLMLGIQVQWNFLKGAPLHVSHLCGMDCVLNHF